VFVRPPHTGRLSYFSKGRPREGGDRMTSHKPPRPLNLGKNEVLVAPCWAS